MSEAYASNFGGAFDDSSMLSSDSKPESEPDPGLVPEESPEAETGNDSAGGSQPETLSVRELMWPMLQAISSLGGEGQRKVLLPRVLDAVGASDAHEQVRDAVKIRAGWSLHWLQDVGLVENPSRGTWRITGKGRDVQSKEALMEIWKARPSKKKPPKKSASAPKSKPGPKPKAKHKAKTPPVAAPSPPPTDDWSSELLRRINNMSDETFERFVTEALTADGFSGIEVRTEPNGDVAGFAQVGRSLVARPLRFRFVRRDLDRTVGARSVRSLRDGEQGSDRSVAFLHVTTGRYSAGALQAAEGLPSVDLFDGQAFADLLKRHQIGVKVEMVESVLIDVDWLSHLETSPIDGDYF